MCTVTTNVTVNVNALRKTQNDVMVLRKTVIHLKTERKTRVPTLTHTGNKKNVNLKNDYVMNGFTQVNTQQFCGSGT